MQSAYGFMRATMVASRRVELATLFRYKVRAVDCLARAERADHRNATPRPTTCNAAIVDWEAGEKWNRDLVPIAGNPECVQHL